MKTRLLWMAGILTFALAGCSWDTAETAMGSCRQQWIEKLSPTFQDFISLKDIQYVSACMESKGFKPRPSSDTCSLNSQVSSAKCYERRMPWE